MRPILMGEIEQDPGAFGSPCRRRVAELLAAQDGVVSKDQVVAAGMSRRAIAHRVRAGEWERVGYGTYLSLQHPFTDAARLRAAALATRGIPHGTAAAWWHGLIDDLDPVLTLTLPANRNRVRSFIGRVRTRRSDLLAADLETVRGIEVTRVPLTLLDCVGPRTDAATLMDRALQNGLVTPTGLRAALNRNANRHGMTAARRLVDVVESDTESEAERRFARLLRAEGIGGWRTQFPFSRYRVDFAWPHDGLAVEVDGWGFHRDAVRFQQDHDKRNALTLARWEVLAFTWHDIDSDPVSVVQSVVDALRDLRAGRG